MQEERSKEKQKRTGPMKGLNSKPKKKTQVKGKQLSKSLKKNRLVEKNVFREHVEAFAMLGSL